MPITVEILRSQWRASFQQRVGQGIGANRGALPCFGLDDAMGRVLLPLAPGVALWIACTVARGLRVTGHAGPEALRVAPIAKFQDGSALIAVDAVLSASGPRPIDAVTFALADTERALQHDHLTVEIKSAAGEIAGRLGVVLGTPALYELVSGRPAPPATSEQDAYGGWRLP
jgi:hypothetical protein